MANGSIALRVLVQRLDAGNTIYHRPTNQELEIMKTVLETIVDCRGKSDGNPKEET